MKFQKVLFMWWSMSIFSFIGHTLTELYGKNWELTANVKTNKFDFLYIEQCL